MRYDIVYLRQKTVNARIFGYVVTFLMIILGFCSLLFFLIVDALGSFPFDLIHISPDIMLLLTSLLSIFVLFRYGFFGGRPSISEISARARREEIYRPSSRPSSSTRTTSRSTTRSTSTQPRTRATTRTQSISTQRPRQASIPRTQKKEKKTKPTLQKLIKYIKPKAGHLSLEDFKCIFCFSLPNYPADQGRGIVVCPNCKRPAHADEFKDWLRNSNLCSRCDATIPAQFRRNPQIIPVKTYLAVMKALAKKK